MKIASSDVLLTSQHAAVEQHSVKESMRAWVGPQRPDFEGRGRSAQGVPADRVALSEQGKATQQAEAVAGAEDEVSNDPRLQLLMSVVEALTGRKVKILSMKELEAPAAPPVENLQDPNQTARGQAAQAEPSAGFGVEYERHETHYEAELTRFSAQGVVRTTDGKEISFRVDLAMQREYLQQSDVSLRLGDAARQAKDPLVINFNGNAAALTSTKFAFDLNADGSAEQISFVTPDSGFLALDKNQDGKVNDGSELFGPATNNGFAELAAYDQDGNKWIDENDAIFDQLRVWRKDAEGNDQLATLLSVGVGAIYLGNVATEFSLKDASNQLDGQVRSSSIYLGENGGAGTVQQIDLAV